MYEQTVASLLCEAYRSDTVFRVLEALLRLFPNKFLTPKKKERKKERKILHGRDVGDCLIKIDLLYFGVIFKGFPT